VENMMPREGHRIVFLGLSSDHPNPEKKFREGMSKLFKISSEADINKLLAKAPVVIRKNLSKEKAASIARKLEMIGGRVRTESDKSTVNRDEKKTAKFKICINEIDDKESKRRVARHLDKILPIDYVTIMSELLGKTPAVLPGEHTIEEAKDIRESLEELGSKVLIIEIRRDNSVLVDRAYERSKTRLAIVIGILLFACISLILLFKPPHERHMESAETKGELQNKVVFEEHGKNEDESSLVLAREAVKALEKLDPGFQVGFSANSMQDLEDARAKVALFLESKETRNRRGLANSIREVMIHYENAGRAWKNISMDVGVLEKQLTETQQWLQMYPKADKPVEQGGASRGDLVYLDAMIPIIMNEASGKLRTVQKVLEADSPVSFSANTS
jgi:hypothetical protein